MNERETTLYFEERMDLEMKMHEYRDKRNYYDRMLRKTYDRLKDLESMDPRQTRMETNG